MSHLCLKSRLLYCSTPREKRIAWELAKLSSNSDPNYSIGLKNDSIYEWLTILTGPQGSPYEEGTFFLDVDFPRLYPSVPPIIKFRTAIYHCNVDNSGTIQLDILQEKWAPTFTMINVMSTIMDLLAEPHTDQALVADIAEHYLTSPQHFDFIAREWTKRYVEL
ncbi:UBC-like protein [Backusella circina FSU 941]|nr:UBC-like protein [Backusella circina FSU 941]